MSARWRPLWLVAGRELREAARHKSFWISAAVVLIGSTALMVVPEILADDDRDRYEVALVGGSSELEEGLAAAVEVLDADLELVDASDADQARQLVDDDEADLGVVVDGAGSTIFVTAGEQERLLGAVRQALSGAAFAERLGAQGLDDEQIQTVLQAPEPRITELDAGDDSRQAAAFLLSLAMYFILIMLMVQVASGVAVEKSNRISEVLLAIIRPGALLFGKVIGVALSGAITLLCGVLPIIVKMALGGELPDGLAGALLGGLAWFVLGAALYLVLAGALGALVERQEEAGSIVTPLNLTLVASYLVGGSAPESSISGVLAYVPLTSPMVMPARIAVGASSVAEMAVSLGLSALAVVVAARFASVVYRRGIVRTGRRLKLREVLRPS